MGSNENLMLWAIIIRAKEVFLPQPCLKQTVFPVISDATTKGCHVCGGVKIKSLPQAWLQMNDAVGMVGFVNIGNKPQAGTD